MTLLSRITLLATVFVLCLNTVGCRKSPTKVTDIPESGRGSVGDSRSTGLDNSTPYNLTDSTQLTDPTGSIPMSQEMNDWIQNRETFKDMVIYFEYDSAIVPSSEIPKFEQIAAVMQTMPDRGLRIEGHCDERGTEEYNRALGEQRALAIRELLVQLNLDAKLIETRSLGEDDPAVQGSDESAWSMNRRGVFVVLQDPNQP